MTKGEIAKEFFKTGLNCSQAVAAAFANEINMDKETVIRLTSGFGGGMGRMREVCGTVSGMTYVISNLFGDKSKGEVYEIVQYAAEKFKEENGSIICRELLGLSTAEKQSPVPEARTEQYYKKRPCAELCKIAADILDEAIKSQK